MDLVIEPAGTIRCIYGEDFDFSSLGNLAITRASHVEPDEHGAWHVELAPVGGPQLGPFASRSQALAAEVGWLEAHWLSSRQ